MILCRFRCYIQFLYNKYILQYRQQWHQLLLEYYLETTSSNSTSVILFLELVFLNFVLQPFVPQQPTFSIAIPPTIIPKTPRVMSLVIKPCIMAPPPKMNRRTRIKFHDFKKFILVCFASYILPRTKVFNFFCVTCCL